MGNGNYYLLTNLISEDEKKVITSIVGHIERGEGNVGIQQIANENFVSPAFIVKFCKQAIGNYFTILRSKLAVSTNRREAKTLRPCWTAWTRKA